MDLVAVATRFALRHKILVTVVWLLLAVAGALTAGNTTSRLTADFSMPGPAATADARIAAHYGHGVQDPVILPVTLPPGQDVTTPSTVTRLRRVFSAAEQVVPGARVTSYANTHDSVFVTRDGRTTYALVSLPPGSPMAGSRLPDAVAHAVQAAAPPGWRVQLTGIGPLSEGASSGDGAGVLAESLIGALGALAVLAFVFASLLGLVPLVMAAISVLVSFLAIGALTYVTGISQIVQFLVALIGLGVAIDYSLLVVTRWREERARGSDNTAAVQTAMASAGRAVVFSGVTVGIGLLALVVLPVPFLRSAGIGGVLIPLISVAVATTLLPVLLDTLGPRLDWPRIRTESSASRGWTCWAERTVRHRVAAATAGIVVLTALVAPVLQLHVGEPRSAALAQSGPARTALDNLTAGGVPPGVLTPVAVLCRADAAEVTVDRLGRLPGVAAVVAPADQRRSGTALVTVLPRAETSIAAGQRTVRAVRAAVTGRPGELGVAGSGPVTLDFSHDVYGSFPLMLGLIAVATFLLLARAFRSVLLSAKAVLLNLVSLGAAYGAMVLIWQQGLGSDLVWGVPATGAITMWVPVMVFAFLFGLSMDYEVFILARMREAYDRTGSTSAAVVEGIGRTGRLVSSAALILVLSFLAMSTGPSTDIKVLATGLGVGILVDATVVRCLLVPALVSLFGRYNWWLPARAARLLRVKTPRTDPAPEAQDLEVAAARS